MATQTIEVGREVTGYHQVTGLSSVKKCPGTGSVVMIQAEGQPVRYRPDDTDPTSAVGIELVVGETHILNVGDGNIYKIRFIETAVSGKINVIAFK